MAGYAPGVFDNLLCAFTPNQEKLTSNRGWFLAIIAFLLPFTFCAVAIFQKLTGLVFPAKNATAVVVLANAFVMLRPWMDFAGANPFLACPAHFTIFTSYIAIRTIGIEVSLLTAALLLRIVIWAVRHWRFVTAIFVFLLILGGSSKQDKTNDYERA